MSAPASIYWVDDDVFMTMAFDRFSRAEIADVASKCFGNEEDIPRRSASYACDP